MATPVDLPAHMEDDVRGRDEMIAKNTADTYVHKMIYALNDFFSTDMDDAVYHPGMSESVKDDYEIAKSRISDLLSLHNALSRMADTVWDDKENDND